MPDIHCPIFLQKGSMFCTHSPAFLCLSLHTYAFLCLSQTVCTLSFCSLRSNTSNEVSHKAAVLCSVFWAFLAFHLLTGILLTWIKPWSSDLKGIAEEGDRDTQEERGVGVYKGKGYKTCSIHCFSQHVHVSSSPAHMYHNLTHCPASLKQHYSEKQICGN